jgi:hypothetical protein
VLDHGGAGLAAIVLRYELWRPGRDDRDLRVTDLLDRTMAPESAARIACAFADPSLTHVFVSRLLQEEAHLLGLPPAPDRAVLLTRGEREWEVVRSWAWTPKKDGFLPFLHQEGTEEAGRIAEDASCRGFLRQ